MDAGKLRHRITLMKPQQQQDSLSGSAITRPVPIASVYAAVYAKSGRTIRTLDQGQIADTRLFIIRQRKDITVDWLIAYDSHRFTVRETDSTRPGYLFITAEASPRHDRI